MFNLPVWRLFRRSSLVASENFFKRLFLVLICDCGAKVAVALRSHSDLGWHTCFPFATLL